ncbi:MAG: DUF2382 domain-containing protein [Anaeromyxobacter sp.]
MPLRKRLLLAAVLALAAGLLGTAARLAWAGRPGAGLALAAATAGAGLAALQALWVRFDVTGRSLRRGPRDRPWVALTFDDGPSGDTPAVLAALDQAGVKASFFVLGEAARRRPGLVREVARRGHLVALHGDSHAKLHAAGPARVARELDRCAAAVRAAGVAPAPFFRAPHGFRGPFLGRALRARGLRLVGWTRGVFDTERPGAGAIAARACRRMRAGEILLLHDGCATPGLDPRRDQTAAAVPEIVARWKAAGFTFVTLDALAGGGRAGRWSPPVVAGLPRSQGEATRREAMDTRGVREGMTVHSADGEKLGKVIECGSADFVIEKGFFFPKDYLVRYEQVGAVEGDDVRLAIPAGTLREAGETGLGAASVGGLSSGEGASTMDRLREGTAAGLGATSQDETRIPVAEEELVAEKREREAGRVQVRKEVVTEQKQLTVPVTREEVHVERVPAEGQPADAAAFQQGTVSVPVREEEVEIRKRPVVREEVRVSRARRQEERRADADVRREEVHVEKEGDIREADEDLTRRDPES